MQRRAKILVASLVGLGAIGVACTFPDVTYQEQLVEAGAGDSASPASDGADEDAGVDAAPPFVDGGATTIVDAEAPRDGAIVHDAAACDDPDSGRVHCDCDGDKYPRANCDAGPGLEDKLDCDDTNADIHPGTSSKTSPMPDGGWDWDCNGKVEKAYPDGYVCGSLGCSNGRLGFEGDLPCGATGDLHQCTGAVGFLLCTDRIQSANTIQSCK